MEKIEINPEDSVSENGAKSFITVSRTSSRSKSSSIKAKVKELELVHRIQAIERKKELEEKRWQIQRQLLEEDEQQQIEENKKRSDEIKAKSAQLKRRRQLEEEEERIKQLQEEIELKAEYEAAKAVSGLLQERKMVSSETELSKSPSTLEYAFSDIKGSTKVKLTHDEKDAINKLSDYNPFSATGGQEEEEETEYASKNTSSSVIQEERICSKEQEYADTNPFSPTYRPLLYEHYNVDHSLLSSSMSNSLKPEIVPSNISKEVKDVTSFGTPRPYYLHQQTSRVHQENGNNYFSGEVELQQEDYSPFSIDMKGNRQLTSGISKEMIKNNSDKAAQLALHEFSPFNTTPQCKPTASRSVDGQTYLPTSMIDNASGDYMKKRPPAVSVIMKPHNSSTQDAYMLPRATSGKPQQVVGQNSVVPPYDLSAFTCTTGNEQLNIQRPLVMTDQGNMHVMTDCLPEINKQRNGTDRADLYGAQVDKQQSPVEYTIRPTCTCDVGTIRDARQHSNLMYPHSSEHRQAALNCKLPCGEQQPVISHHELPPSQAGDRNPEQSQYVYPYLEVHEQVRPDYIGQDGGQLQVASCNEIPMCNNEEKRVHDVQLPGVSSGEFNMEQRNLTYQFPERYMYEPRPNNVYNSEPQYNKQNPAVFSREEVTCEPQGNRKLEQSNCMYPYVVPQKQVGPNYSKEHGRQPNLESPEQQTQVPDRSATVPSSHQNPNVVELPEQQTQVPDRSATVPSSHQNPNVVQLVREQSNLTRLLLEQQLKASLPQRSMKPFDGNPLNFVTFMRAFEHGIESKTSDVRERLYYLEQYTVGDANKLVKSCMHVDDGYQRAKDLLRKRFGDKHRVAEAFVKKVTSWPDVKANDSAALNRLSLFLEECRNVLTDLDCLTELDHATSLRSIVSKLPYSLRDSWRRRVDCIVEEQGNTVKFVDLVNFIEKQARVLSNPLYGNINPETQPTTKTSAKRTPVGSNKQSSFAVSVDQKHDQKHMERCTFCGDGSHTLDTCKQMLKTKTNKEIVAYLKEKGLCFGCLRKGFHKVKDCSKKLKCTKCSGKHPTILHREDWVSKKPKVSNSAAPSQHREQENKTTATNLTSAGGRCHSYTGAGNPDIVPCVVNSPRTGVCVKTYAFLDKGSNAVFCTDKLRHQLGLKGRNVTVPVQTLLDEQSVESRLLKDLEVADLQQENVIKLPGVYVTGDKMPASREDVITEQDIQDYDYLSHVQLPELDDETEVGILIGNNVPEATEPWEVIHSEEGGPYAYRTLLGWIVSGLSKACDKDRPVSANRIVVGDNIEQRLINMYNQEFTEKLAHEEIEWSEEDRIFIDRMSTEVKLVGGHCQLPLPLRGNAIFPNNLTMAECRLINLKKRMVKDPAFGKEYKDAMCNMIETGYAERAPVLKESEEQSWFIPHHAVYHPRKHKLRVVFDCAASFKGVSLNHNLLQGPDLTNSLTGVLLRFRQEPIAIMADIKAMFNQVKVPIRDRNFLRFLWWPEGDVTKPIEEYRMTTHLFGATSSPACANFALQWVANEAKGEVRETIKKNFYVDDCLKSTTSEQKAVHLVQDLKKACEKGGFNLTKWASNSKEVIESIPIEDRAESTEHIGLGESVQSQGALGMVWLVESDKLAFRIEVKDRPPTRRGILSIVSGIYDPLGYVSPVILPAKQVLQNLSKLQISWDEPIPELYRKQWNQWIETVPELSAFTVPRCLLPSNFGTPTSVQVHNFSDASEVGYGVVSYLRFTNQEDDVHCSLVLSKSRVAPLKQITVPRLELAAATVAVKINYMIQKELEFPIERTFYWTDSTTVLQYIRSETKRFKTFVANRLAVIKDGSKPDQWRYVATSINPADDCSRGVPVKKFLENRRWIEGPEFLWKRESEWLEDEVWDEIHGDDPELKKGEIKKHVRETVSDMNEIADEVDREMKFQKDNEMRKEDNEVRKEDDVIYPEEEQIMVNVVNIKGEENDAVDMLIEYYSSWHSLKKAVAYILKIKDILLHRVKRRKELISGDKLRESSSVSTQQEDENQDSQVNYNPKTQPLMDKTSLSASRVTVEDMQEAEDAIISYVQRKEFPNEFSVLKKGNNMSKSSSVYRLDPKLEDGVLRVGGRLHRAALPELAKHPAILPNKHHVTSIILQHIHETKGHSGRNHMLACLRQRFWVIGANSAARRIISRCVVCKRQRGKVQQQKMANLPESRVKPNDPPFTKVGMDYFGPFLVKRGRSEVKRYGVIFTCLSTRAVHLEMADGLDTDSCINAIRRFVARRGQVTEMWSDNGTNLVGAERVLRAEINKWNQAKIHESLLQKNIKWVFSPPAGSHFGGIWERQIRSIRKVINSVVKEQTLNDESLRTLFCEVECILNGRPLTKVSSDANDLEALTPNHLLLLKTKPVLPPKVTEPTDKYTRRWKQVQYMSDLFWKRWIKEYLPELQERQRWLQLHRNVEIGDIVLVVDNSAPRGSWPLGRIVETMPDQQGNVRSVRVKTKGSTLVRPICKLVLLLEGDNQ